MSEGRGCTRKRKALPAVRFQRRDQKSVMLLLRYGWSKWGAVFRPTMLVARLAGPSISRLRKAYMPRTAPQPGLWLPSVCSAGCIDAGLGSPGGAG